jgi:hypothetical protein
MDRYAVVPEFVSHDVGEKSYEGGVKECIGGDV